MDSALAVAFLWALFGGLHVGLGAAPVRTRLVARLGEPGFTAVFFAAATVSFASLVACYTAHRFDGAPGPGLGAVPALRWLLVAVVVAGVALAMAGLAAYPRLPSALFGQPIRTPRGIERITRHPFFAGTALFAAAHALLAPRLTGAVFVAGFAALALLGARYQDRKLLARRGRAYADYLAATSTVPFAAVLAGRQRIVWRELPVGTLAAGLGAALALRAGHDRLFAHGGVWVIAAVVGGGILASVQAWRRARRLRSA